MVIHHARCLQVGVADGGADELEGDFDGVVVNPTAATPSVSLTCHP